MDTKSLRSKTHKALEKELTDAQAHLKELQFKLSSNQLSHVREVRRTRKFIARLLTILHEQDALHA